MGPIMGVLNQLLDKIHNNFTNKIEALCLEKTVAYYVQAFLVSADKKRFKTVDVILLLNFSFIMKVTKNHRKVQTRPKTLGWNILKS